MMKLGFIGLVLLALASNVFAAAYEQRDFNSSEQAANFQQMISVLRCPKCQNQNLADSNSPIAKDLRDQVYRLQQEGKDEQQIKEFMVARYGNFVLYEPPLDKYTYALWLTPIILLLLAFLVLWRIKRQQKSAQGALTETEQQTLQNLLQRFGD